MANRRMLSKDVIRSDKFIGLSFSAQALYVQLNLETDDEGFVNNPNVISRLVGGSDDDLQELAEKGFIIIFDSGVVVLCHFHLNNYIQPDRRHKTAYGTEKNEIFKNANDIYEWKPPAHDTDTECIQSEKKITDNEYRNAFKRK